MRDGLGKGNPPTGTKIAFLISSLAGRNIFELDFHFVSNLTFEGDFITNTRLPKPKSTGCFITRLVAYLWGFFGSPIVQQFPNQATFSRHYSQQDGHGVGLQSY